MRNVKMMSTQPKARLSVNVDEKVKLEAGKILKEIGLDYTTAVNIYFKRIISERKIPFELSAGNVSVDDFFGVDWRDGLENVADEWN